MTDVKEVIELMGSLLSDSTVPRNVKNAVQQARDKLESDAEWNVKIGGAIYSLEEVGSDINLPAHARSVIWSILSELESLREQK